MLNQLGLVLGVYITVCTIRVVEPEIMTVYEHLYKTISFNLFRPTVPRLLNFERAHEHVKSQRLLAESKLTLNYTFYFLQTMYR